MSDDLIKRIASKFTNKTLTFDKLDSFDPESKWISTGSPSLDMNLRSLGYTNGIVEIRGESQSGKTTLSLHAIKSALQKYKDKAIVVILSSERRDNKAYAENLGIDTSKVIVHLLRNVETVTNRIITTIKETEEILNEQKENIKDYFFLFIWDSLGQTVSRQELEKSIENAKSDKTEVAALGSTARALSVCLKSIIGLQDDYNLLVCVINRPYANIDGRGGKKSFGGSTITLFPYMRLELIRKQGVVVGEEELGQITIVKTMKNDFDRPHQEFEIEIMYGYGIVISEDDIKLGVEAGILTKFGHSGAKFMNGKLKWKNRPELYQLYRDKNPLLKVLIKQLTDYANKTVLKNRGY